MSTFFDQVVIEQFGGTAEFKALLDKKLSELATEEEIEKIKPGMHPNLPRFKPRESWCWYEGVFCYLLDKREGYITPDRLIEIAQEAL